MSAAIDFVNDNSISAIALTFFTALIGGVVTIIVAILQLKGKAIEAKNEAAEARANTQNIANGFAGGVDRKLDSILEKQDCLEEAFRDHIKWHLNHPG